MLENIGLSFQGIWSHKLRSLLTMLGIIIGIAAIIAIVSTIQGTNEQIKQNLIGSGDNSIVVQLYQGDWPLDISWQGIPAGVPEISDDVLADIRNIPEVYSATRFLSRDAFNDVFHLNTSITGGSVMGIEEDFFHIGNFYIRGGRVFVESDFGEFRRVAVLDRDSAGELFPNSNPVGQVIEISQVPFTVVGVVEQIAQFEPVINTVEDFFMYMDLSSGRVYVPYTVWPAIYAYDEPQSLLVRVERTEDMPLAGRQSAAMLNAFLPDLEDGVSYRAVDVLEQAQQIQQLSQSTNMMLIWIAGISLLVGGIGVMNIMLVSVTERTQEIGLKKAIGARKHRLLFQFLTEAMVLTSLGGVLGVLVGILLAEIISQLNDTLMIISVPAAALAILFSMFIGIVFGFLPAYKASNLNPIEALRHE